MKKTLLALAALSAIAGSAAAQSNVTIYGIVDAGLAREDNGATTTNRLDAGTQSGSRIGFRAIEDLGDGMSVIAVMENGFATDTGAATQGGLLFGREASVGVRWNGGLVKLGRFKTPIYMALDNLDPFNVGLGGGADRIFYNGTIVLRADNTLRYETPNINGFTGSLAYSFGEVAGSTSANRQIGAGLDYLNGPFDVRFAWHKRNANAPVNTDVDTWVLGGVYNFGPAKLHLVAGADKLDAAGSPTVKTRDLMAGVTVPVGAHKFLASWSRNKLDDVANSTSNQYALGYNYNFSKRTNLYASYSRLSNDSAVRIKAAANGQTDTLMTFGIRHFF